ncbi:MULTISPECIES: DUF1178 family protein [Shimia]|uniref:DUF1178 family protein n=1 Tax=Shimia TaxID=573139 RepID=UPI001FB41EBA|nr:MULTISPECIES: DUF1178 family protein [Shimia]MDV4143818.1 DUF1178 family protein [Shimia sp. FJ5]
MIQYTLKCSQDHRFDSWFQSADAFDKLRASGMIVCAVCGDSAVEKAMMAPRVRPARKSAAPEQPQPTQENARPLAAPTSEAEKALAALKKTVEENSDYVGKNFVKEARDMHLGAKPERAIYGEAKIEDAKALIEEGVPVAPLPFRATRKSN